MPRCGDMIEVFKILRGLYDASVTAELYSCEGINNTRASFEIK